MKFAYVRFASVYRQFRDVNEFVDEIKKSTKTLSMDESPNFSLSTAFIQCS